MLLVSEAKQRTGIQMRLLHALLGVNSIIPQPPSMHAPKRMKRWTPELCLGGPLRWEKLDYSEETVRGFVVTAVVQEIPLPPDELMIAVAGHANHADFARSRIKGPEQMLADLAAAAVDSSQLVDVLDFGCGCGRFLAGWVMNGSKMRLQGCDYNSELVNWCNQHIPGVNVRINSLGQDLPFENDSFDFAYLLSVFTHLSIGEQRLLVSELRRILRPGGYVYITFHGEYFCPTMFPQIERGEAIFRRDGFLIQNQNLEGRNDCWTLHSPEHLSGIFGGFVLLKHFRSLERGPTDVAAWQDSMIFQAQ